jgi:hypothetical protein
LGDGGRAGREAATEEEPRMDVTYDEVARAMHRLVGRELVVRVGPSGRDGRLVDVVRIHGIGDSVVEHASGHLTELVLRSTAGEPQPRIALRRDHFSGAGAWLHGVDPRTAALDLAGPELDFNAVSALPGAWHLYFKDDHDRVVTEITVGRAAV